MVYCRVPKRLRHEDGVKLVRNHLVRTIVLSSCVANVIKNQSRRKAAQEAVVTLVHDPLVILLNLVASCVPRVVTNQFAN